MQEIWKPVPSMPGLLASSLGRIQFPTRTAEMPNGGTREYKTRPIWGTKTKSSRTARHCYMGAYNKHYGNVKVHRAVCEAFHGPAPFPKAVVIHLNENGTDNRAENLKWGTQKENLNMPGFLEYCRNRTWNDNPRIKGKMRQAEKDRACP